MLIDVVKFGQNCAFSQDAMDALIQAESKLEANHGLSVFPNCREQLFLGVSRKECFTKESESMAFGREYHGRWCWHVLMEGW